MEEHRSTNDQPGCGEAATREPAGNSESHGTTPAGRQPRQYRIICAIRRADGRLKALGYTKNGNGVMYDGTWTIAEARQAIFQGHRLYTVSSSTGDAADLEFADGRIRTKPNQTTDATLQNLPDCSRR